MSTLNVLLTLVASVFRNGKSYEFGSPCRSWKDSTDLNLFVVHCSNLDMLKLQRPTFEYLDVSNCTSDFKMDVLPPMADLREIHINNCHIVELQKKQFVNLIQLNKLDLSGNFIEKLSNESFYKLSSLAFLYLQNNSIEVLPEGVFNTLEYLHTLDLSFNKLSNLSKDIFLGIRDLTNLYLKGNPLRTIHLENPIGNGFLILKLDLRYCEQLRDMRVYGEVNHLNLENSGLQKLEIRGTIFSIKHKNSKVTHADLHGSKLLQSFSEVLCRMPSLEWLDLSNSTEFVSFSPSELYKYVNEHIPMCDFPNLRFLNLSRTEISNISQRLPLFGPNLITLDLSHNLLEHVSLNSFAEAQNSLQSLYLEGNRLISFDYKSVCDGLKNLKRLTLFDNLFNATFYDEMTNYYHKKKLHLIQKEHIIIKTEDQEKHKNSNEKSNQTLPRTQDDINHVTPTASGILSGTEDHQPSIKVFIIMCVLMIIININNC